MSRYLDILKSAPADVLSKLDEFKMRHKEEGAEHARIVEEVIDFSEKIAQKHAKNIQKKPSKEFQDSIKAYLLSLYLAPWSCECYFPYKVFQLVFEDLVKTRNQSQAVFFIGPWHTYMLLTYHQWLFQRVSFSLMQSEMPNLLERESSAVVSIQASAILEKKEIFEKYFQLVPLDLVIKICEESILSAAEIKTTPIKEKTEKRYIDIIKIFSALRSDVFNQEYCNSHPWAQEWLELFDSHGLKTISKLCKNHEKEMDIETLMPLSVSMLESRNPNIEVMLRVFGQLKSSGFFIDASLKRFTEKNQIVFTEVESLEKSIRVTQQSLYQVQLLRSNLGLIDTASKSSLDAAYRAKEMALSRKITEDSFFYLTLFYSLISKLKEIHSFSEAEQEDTRLMRLSSLKEISSTLSLIESKVTQKNEKDLSSAEDVISSIFDSTEIAKKNTTSSLMIFNDKSTENSPALNEKWYAEIEALNKQILKMKPFFEQFIIDFNFDREVLASVFDSIQEKALSFYPSNETRGSQRHYWSLFFRKFASIITQDTENVSQTKMKDKSFKILLSAIRIAENHPDYEDFKGYIRDIFIHASSHIPFEDLCRYIEKNQSTFEETVTIISSRLAKHYYSPNDVFAFFTKAFDFWKNEIVETKSIEILIKSLDVILGLFRRIPKQQFMVYIEMLLSLAESKTEISDVLFSHLFSIASLLSKVDPVLSNEELFKIGQMLTPHINKNASIKECFEFLNVFARELMNYSGENPTHLSAIVETLIAQSESDNNLVKLCVMLIDKFHLINILSDIQMLKLKSEWQAFLKLKSDPNLLESRLEGQIDADSFSHALKKMASVLSLSSEDDLLFSEKIERRDLLNSRLDRLETILKEAKTLHIRTKQTTDKLIGLVESPANGGSLFAKEVDAILDELEEKQEENRYENFDYLSSQIRLRHLDTLEKILVFVEGKLSMGDQRYESHKILCLKYAGFYRDALDYVNLLLEKNRFQNKSFKHRFILENKAIFLEKMGEYDNAIDCRTKINDNFYATVSSQRTYNLSRIFNLYLKIGDAPSFEKLRALIEASLQKGFILEEMAQSYRTKVLIGLNRYHEVETDLDKGGESDITMIQKMTLLCAKKQYQAALEIAIDLLQRRVMNDNQLFAFFMECFYQFPDTAKEKLRKELNMLFDEISKTSLKNYVVYSIFMSGYMEQNEAFLANLQKYAEQYGEDEYYLRAYSIYLCQIKSPGDAVLLLEKHLNFVEKNHRLLLELAVCYTKNKQYAKSKQVFYDLLVRFPHYPALYMRALFAFNKMQHFDELPSLLNQSQKFCNAHRTKEKVHVLMEQNYPDVVYLDEMPEDEHFIDQRAISSLECFPKVPHLISNFFHHRMCDQRASKHKWDAFNLSPHYSLPYSVEALDLPIESTYRKLSEKKACGIFLKQEDPDDVASYDEVTNRTLQAVQAKLFGR